MVYKAAYKGTYRVKTPAPYILHTGERVLSIYDQIQEKLPMPEKREP